MEGVIKHSSIPDKTLQKRVSVFFISPLDIVTSFTDLLKNKTWELNIGQINLRDPKRNMTMMIDSVLFFIGNGYPSSQNPADCWNCSGKPVIMTVTTEIWGKGSSGIQKTVSTWRSKVGKDS